MPKLIRAAMLACAALVSSPVWSALPEPGMWSFEGELDGKPGRGLQIDRQGGSLVIVTYFGFRPDGSALFLQASGQLENARFFRGQLMEYRNGRDLVGPPRSGEAAKNHGEISLDFENTTNGTVQIPGDGVRSISRYVFENSLHWFSNYFNISVGPSGYAAASFQIDGDHMRMVWKNYPQAGSPTPSGCELDGSFIRAGKGYRSEGTMSCTGYFQEPQPYRLEDLAIDEYGGLTARLYNPSQQATSFTFIHGVCVRMPSGANIFPSQCIHDVPRTPQLN